MRETTTLDAFLGDIEFAESEGASAPSWGALVSFRISPEHKAKYIRLQQKSRRRFSKKICEAIQALIEAAEARAS